MVKIDEHFMDNLVDFQQDIIKEQMARFDKLSKEERRIIPIKDEIIMPEGTLIHGTIFDKEVVSNIAKTGIITGQYFGIEEFGETYYCADFHRVHFETNIEDYERRFSYHDGRCPFEERMTNAIALIVYPDERLKELLVHDCYKEGNHKTNHSKWFVNERVLPIKSHGCAAGILFGIPSNFINGIVVGNDLVNLETIEFLTKEFPNIFVAGRVGRILYKPGDTDEMIKLRVECAQKVIEYEQIKKNTENAMNDICVAISNMTVREIAKIVRYMKFEGDPLETAEELKNNHKKIYEKIYKE